MTADWEVHGTHEVEFNEDQARDQGFRAEIDHMAGFNAAIVNALENWNHSGDRPASMKLSLKIRKVNPGWVLKYGASMTPSGAPD